jgi:hypothetical protein
VECAELAWLPRLVWRVYAACCIVCRRERARAWTAGLHVRLSEAVFLDRCRKQVAESDVEHDAAGKAEQACCTGALPKWEQGCFSGGRFSGGSLTKRV